MINASAQSLLSLIKLPEADFISVRRYTERSNYMGTRNGKSELNYIGFDDGLMVEVLFAGQFAYSATSTINKEAIQACAEIALKKAKAALNYKIHNFSLSQRLPSVGKYVSPRIKEVPVVLGKEYFDLAITLSNAMQISSKIVNSSIEITTSNIDTDFASTNGANFQQEFSFVAVGASAYAQDERGTQSRSMNGHRGNIAQRGLEGIDANNLIRKAVIIAEEAFELLGAEECPITKMDLVLAPDQMMLQIHESIGHPLELDRILGDERNYAGWSFVKQEDFGRLRYGSELLNATFDPTIEGELASYKFDDCGQKAEKQYIIEKGILKRALGGLESTSRTKIEGVANFRSCSWNRAPIDRISNLNVEPGDKSLEQIISSVERGIYMHTNRSWSIDDYRNKFQFGCEYGKLIENGKLTKTVKNPNYRGISVPFWNSLFLVGDKSTFEIYGTPNCGKGEPNQVIWVGHGSPVCAFKNIEIFGGGK